MELLTTSGSGARKVERLLQSLEQRGAVNLDRVERQVRRIVDDVRRGGDRALLAARAQFDGVAKSSRCASLPARCIARGRRPARSCTLRSSWPRAISWSSRSASCRRSGTRSQCLA